MLKIKIDDSTVFYKLPITRFYTFFGLSLLLINSFVFYSQPLLADIIKEKFLISKDRIMTLDEFKEAINNNDFLKQESKTINDQPLDEHEVEAIESAIKNEHSNFGGGFDYGREIDNFTGDTLVVGGGKKSGMYGENDGKTILIDEEIDSAEIKELIENLDSGNWKKDPYTGKEFKTDAEKKSYIKMLKRKREVYKEASREKNKDILNRYYTLNIEKIIQPDILASITSVSDMSKIPDKKFMHIEFENVPCHVFLNPKLYSILERTIKPEGTIKFSICYDCRRLIVPLIQSTKFGKEFLEKLKVEMYDKLEEMNPMYGSHTITIVNNSK